jgi:putative transposase
VTPQQKRDAVAMVRATVNISERRACGLVGISRTVLHYDPKVALGNEQLKARIVQLATERRRFGYRRIHALVAREGIRANHKRIYRLYTQANLAVRRRKKRRGLEVDREALVLPRRPNDTWSMDFVMDTFATGRRLKCLTIVDDCTKEAVDIVADTSIPGQYVARVLDRVAQFRGYPKAIRTDQGPEFTCRALDQWAYRNGVQLKLIQPGKPTQNAYIESFNGRFRDECLNDHWFLTLEHARAIIATWRRDYNESRPHSSLGYMTPAEFARSVRSEGLITAPTIGDAQQ